MEVSLTPEHEARLEALAAARGSDTQAMVRDMLERALEYEEWFLREVEKGIEQADRGELIDHDEVVRRMAERFAGR